MKKEITLSQLKENRKKMLVHFNLPMKVLGIPAPYISYILIKFTKITANQLTLFWILLETIGITLIALGSYKLAILGIAIVHIAIMLDNADGDIARSRNQKTIGGPYLDNIALALHRSLLLAAVGIGLYNSGHSINYLYIGTASAFILMFTSVIESKIRETLFEKGFIKVMESPRERSLKFQKWKKLSGYLRTGEPLNIMYIALIINYIPLTIAVLIFYFMVVSVLFARRFYLIYKKTGNLKNIS